MDSHWFVECAACLPFRGHFISSCTWECLYHKVQFVVYHTSLWHLDHFLSWIVIEFDCILFYKYHSPISLVPVRMLHINLSPLVIGISCIQHFVCVYEVDCEFWPYWPALQVSWSITLYVQTAMHVPGLFLRWEKISLGTRLSITSWPLGCMCCQQFLSFTGWNCYGL